MKTPSLIVVGIAAVFLSAADLRAQHVRYPLNQWVAIVPSKAAQSITLPFLAERNLEEKLAPKKAEPDLKDFIKFDFRLGDDDLISLVSNGLNRKIAADETINLKPNKLVLRYELPRDPPQGLFDFADKVILRPIRRFLTDHTE